jgi:hypothetical protein
MFSMVSFGGNRLSSIEDGAEIKPAKAMKGLPSQLSLSRDKGSPNDQLIVSGVRPFTEPVAISVLIAT